MCIIDSFLFLRICEKGLFAERMYAVADGIFCCSLCFFEDDTVSINVGCIVVCETFASWPVSLFTLCLFV